MEVNSVLVNDTNGDLSTELFKIHVDSPALSAWLTDNTEQRTLKLSPNNIRFDSIPNINGSTYKTFLTYNGTLGYSNKVFSTVVAETSGIFDQNVAPVLEYNPSNIMVPETVEELENVVIDIAMFNGQIDILEYSQGILSQGEKTYFVKSRRAFPTKVHTLPNVGGRMVYMDGWYSYTTIIFRNIQIGATVTEGTFYAMDEFIFKASDNGIIDYDSINENYFIIPAESPDEVVVQMSNEDYEELLFSLNETSGMEANANNIYLHTQILVTDQIRDAITAEVVSAAFEGSNDFIDFQNWQKLVLKRQAAAIFFENDLFENAQIVIESSRTFCLSGKYNVNCK